MRKGISVVLGFLLLASAILTAKYLIDNKQKPKQRFNKVVKTVFVDEVKNTSVPIVITANGNLVGKNKIELYAEVQGVLVATSKEFKSGTHYAKGELLIKINSDGS
jgi:membrane fusion protein (multidrug efflux system)